jgi:hypothetical protein
MHKRAQCKRLSIDSAVRSAGLSPSRAARPIGSTISSDRPWRRAVERLASTVGIGADKLPAFEEELYDLKSEYEGWKRNDPGPTAAARRKLEALARLEGRSRRVR